MLLFGGDVRADGLRRPLHCLGRHLQIGQQFQLLTALIERGLLTDHGQHAAHSRRELRVFDVQFDISRKLAVVTVPAQVVRARYFHLAHCCQDRLGALFVVVRLMATRTREGPLVCSRGCESQQFGQGGRPGMMHGRANRHLDGFEIEVAGFASGAEDDAQQLIYFARDFLLDRFDHFGRFFSWADDGISATGRSWQICSLTSNS